ncbi:pilus assembly protein CpaE [Caldanaerovirga acetigignens]|uniref:Stage 0 sporulation protein A homolog n=1 Tax=Caldanaerovirga acetigignens TaxID=447595 RepID=A0A1M7IPS3_9FIRM|nr:response regulator [Caldanaerovirga acetigignens]SHM42669.1 pilus assembly protein CpaE [Caldanaerovirga acetigignens]
MPIRVLIADDIPTTREDIKRLLYFEEDIEVVGEAIDGQDAVSMAVELKPDVVLMDINMPNLDGIAATEQIAIVAPQTAIIIISIQGEYEYLRKAMAAGAREYLVKPFSAEELANAIRRVHEAQKRRNALIANSSAVNLSNFPVKKKGKIITFFSTKGGVGRTTLSCNLAVMLAQETKKDVALLDFDLESGDVTIMLNISAKMSLADLAKEEENIDIKAVEGFLIPHISGVKVLPAPLSPEQAELITPTHVEQLLKVMKENFDFLIIDASPLYSEINLMVLERSDIVVLVLTQELTSIKHVKTDAEILKKLNCDFKIRFVLNCHDNEGIKVKDVERALGKPILAVIPADSKTVKNAVNQGIPFVMAQPNARVAEGIKELFEKLELKNEEIQKDKKRPLIMRMFSL